MEKFDVVVIGSGPAGFAAAMRSLDFGFHVAIIEAQHIGGAGVMNGALTSKTMYELSKDYAVAANVSRGYRAGGLTVDYEQVRKTVLQAAKDKQYQILSQIETFSKTKSAHGSLTLFEGRAYFKSPDIVQITTSDDIFEIEGKHFVIATGSRPRQLLDLPCDGERIISSDDILKLNKFPERMIIIGSGIIGCEFATIFSNYKQTEVHLLDRAKRVLPTEDDDVSDFVSSALEKNGVIVHHTAQLRTIRKKSTHLEVILDYDDGHSKVIEVDVALVAIGRKPNTDNLGLENAGISLSKRGMIDVADNCMYRPEGGRCHIYAAGDISGHGQLYNIAEYQGRMVAENIAGEYCLPTDYDNMSTLMFFKPEVAAVGANEKMLQAKNIPYKVAYYSNQLVNRAIAMRNTNGFIKIMVSNDGNFRILGMRAAGPQASSFIVSVAHLINQGNSLHEIIKVLHPHPSLSEGIQECFRTLLGKSIFKPEAFPELISIREWNPEKD